MKSAYELALERLESQGIDRPDAASLSEEDRGRMADVRQRAEAKLAELEILHKERLAKAQSFADREEQEEHYRLERRRIEDNRDAKVEEIRRAKSRG